MIYVISDIHGCFEQYRQLLETVNFSDNDTLYVLGDIIDRGPDSMAVLEDMMSRPNVIGLIGDHEYMALQSLYALMPELKDLCDYPFLREGIESGTKCWLDLDGGRTTYESFQSLPEEKQKAILNYLWNLKLFEKITVNDKTYLLSHGWLSSFEEDKTKHPYLLFEQRFQSPDFENLYHPEGKVILGHQPTRFLEGLDHIIISENYIAIDGGAYLGGKLAMLCLDTMIPYYA